MQKGIIGKKLGMTQIFDEKGNVVPVTVIEAGPCVVTQKKTVETDGYNAVQLGFGEVKLKFKKGAKSSRTEKFQGKPSNITMALAGHFEKNGVAPKKYLREFRFDSIDGLNVGDLVKADTFAAGDKVDVVGTSKGKGWAGVIKRWNFGRLKESHGTGPVHRHGGSIGACSDPSCPVTSATRELPCRISQSSRSMLKTTLSPSRAQFPVLRAALCSSATASKHKGGGIEYGQHRSSKCS